MAPSSGWPQTPEAPASPAPAAAPTQPPETAAAPEPAALPGEPGEDPAVIGIRCYRELDFSCAAENLAMAVTMLPPEPKGPQRERALQLRRLLAITYAALDDRRAALAQFQAILYLDPEFRLEAGPEVPPKIVQVFEEALALERTRQAERRASAPATGGAQAVPGGEGNEAGGSDFTPFVAPGWTFLSGRDAEQFGSGFGVMAGAAAPIAWGLQAQFAFEWLMPSGRSNLRVFSVLGGAGYGLNWWRLRVEAGVLAGLSAFGRNDPREATAFAVRVPVSLRYEWDFGLSAGVLAVPGSTVIPEGGSFTQFVGGQVGWRL